ncbi:hypothetical protein [Pseudonocardia sp. WMMC193]|nr:hypothetical protein [Pseudonocardia sp. WMMC193]MCF7547332.1 hypothetical protein [Pseudonocardia sp. WMMC193]
MFRTATTTPTTATTVGFDSEGAWREFGDREANQDRIGADLGGALNEPGF